MVVNSHTEATGIIGEGVLSLLTGRTPVRRFPRVDRSYRPDRSLWPRLAGTYRATVPQSSMPGPLPIEFDGERLRAHTYPGDHTRRPGDIHLYPVGNTSFVLFGRGRTGARAGFEVDGDAVRATWMGVALEQVLTAPRRDLLEAEEPVELHDPYAGTKALEEQRGEQPGT
jgi:hypothetical protein